MGVTEHVFDVSLHGRTVTWHLYDVGGARGQRHSWVPYFDDAWVLYPIGKMNSADSPHIALQLYSWHPSVRSTR